MTQAVASGWAKLKIEAAAAEKQARIDSAQQDVASIGLAHQATLVTRNVKDFRQIPGLKVENGAA